MRNLNVLNLKKDLVECINVYLSKGVLPVDVQLVLLNALKEIDELVNKEVSKEIQEEKELAKQKEESKKKEK